MKLKKQFFFLFIFLLSATTTFAQKPVVVQINADSIEIGDPVEMEFVVNINGSTSIEKVYFADYDSIESMVKLPTPEGGEETFYADFEFQNFGTWKTPTDGSYLFEKPDLAWNDPENEPNLIRNTLIFTIWNEGIYLIPPVQITFNRGGRTYTQNTNPIPLMVGSPLLTEAAQTDSIALSPIKEIIAEPTTFEDFVPYIIAFIFLIHLLCLIYFLTNNQQKVEILPIPVTQILGHELANTKLQKLQAAELWQQGKTKKYLSYLTFIVREYLENRFSIPALESTSSQILRQLKTAHFTEKTQNDLRSLFQQSDLVKFAKAEPQLEFLENSFQQTTQLIREKQSNQNLIWVEIAKLNALQKEGETALEVVDDSLRVTENLEELTNPKKLIYADFWERFAARALDLLFFMVIWVAVIAIISLVQGISVQSMIDWNNLGLLAGTFLLISWFYFGLMEAQKGATFGKLVMGLQVTNKEGEQISILQSTLRWLGKIISELFFFFANFWFYFDKERIQTLYDRISKTIVIKS